MNKSAFSCRASRVILRVVCVACLGLLVCVNGDTLQLVQAQAPPADPCTDCFYADCFRLVEFTCTFECGGCLPPHWEDDVNCYKIDDVHLCQHIDCVFEEPPPNQYCPCASAFRVLLNPLNWPCKCDGAAGCQDNFDVAGQVDCAIHRPCSWDCRLDPIEMFFVCKSGDGPLVTTTCATYVLAGAECPAAL
jgi:hypothetical protein